MVDGPFGISLGFRDGGQNRVHGLALLGIRLDRARPAFERMRVAVTRQLANLPASVRPVTVSLVDAAGRRPE